MILTTILIIHSTISLNTQRLSAEISEKPNIILFSWDGFQRNHLLELLNNGSLPNLQSFIDQGSFLNLTVIDYVTQTKPGHAQMLTGYRGEHTGVYSNALLLHPIPRGYTLLERLEEYYGEDDIATSMITGKLTNVHPVFVDTTEGLDFVSIENVSSYLAGPKMLRFLEDHKNDHFAAFFHFAEPDIQGHEFGENSVEYGWGAMSCDYWLQKVLDKLEELELADNTLVYVTTDHGFNENEMRHRSDPDIWIASNDLSLRVNTNDTRGNMIDITPTIFYALGIDYTKYRPPLEGYPLQESLPEEASLRIIVMNDTASPIIAWKYGFNRIEIKEGEKVHLRFNVSDSNLRNSYLLHDDVLVEVFYPEDEYDINGTISREIDYMFDSSTTDKKYHEIELITFDERENMSEINVGITIIDSKSNNLTTSIMRRLTGTVTIPTAIILLMSFYAIILVTYIIKRLFF